MSDENDVIERIKMASGDTSKHTGYLIALLTHAILQIDERLKAIERRIDKADDYIQEQNERDIEP